MTRKKDAPHTTFLVVVALIAGLAMIFSGVMAATSSRRYDTRSDAAGFQKTYERVGEVSQRPALRLILVGDPAARHAVNTPYLQMRWGDVNNSGELDEGDVERLEDYLAGSSQLTVMQMWHADVNGDGVLDALDLGVLGASLQSGDELVYMQDSVYDEVVYGDVNADAVVNVLDGLVISKYVKGDLDMSLAQLWAADVTGDARVTQEDVDTILELEVGIIDTLPVEVQGRDVGVIAVARNGEDLTDQIMVNTNVDVRRLGQYRVQFSHPESVNEVSRQVLVR